MPTIEQFSEVTAPIGTSTLPVTVTLVPGDLLVLVSSRGQGGGRTFVPSGIGTWVTLAGSANLQSELGNNAMQVHTLTGATGTGTITFTVAGEAPRVVLFVVRGLAVPSVFGYGLSSYPTGNIGTPQGVGVPVTIAPGQVALSVAAIPSSAGSTWSFPDAASIPSAGAWTLDTAASSSTTNGAAAAHVIGGSIGTTSHQAMFKRLTGPVSGVGGISLVLGEPAAASALIQSDYVEALTIGTPTSVVDAEYAEVLTIGTPQATLDSAYVEVLSMVDGTVHVFAEYVEVLTRWVDISFVGWGIPAGIVAAEYYRDEVLADSPLIYYRMNETSGTTLVDSGPNGYHGTYSGSPTLGAASLLTASAGGASVDFDGVNDYAFLDTGNINTTNFTIEAWIRLDTTSGGRDIAGRRNPAGFNSEIWQFRVLSGGKLDLFIVSSGTYYTTMQSTTSLTAGVTYHVAGVYDGSTVKLYINGVLDATHAHTANPNIGATSVTPFRIGQSAFASPNDEWFDGRIAEVAFYSIPLSAARIAAHYAAGGPTTLASTLAAMAPVGQWMADETSGTSMLDSTANARHGTYTNSPTLGAASFLTGDVKAVLLDGVNDRISIPHNVAFNTQTVGFTVVIGFKINAPTANKAQVIIDKNGTSGVDGQWSLFWENRSSQGSPQRLRAILGTNTFDWTGAAATAAVGAGGVFTIREGGESGTNDTLRYNGAQKSSGPITGRAATTRQIDIGCVNGASTPALFLDGSVAFVAIFDRPITNAEIAAIEAKAGV